MSANKNTSKKVASAALAGMMALGGVPAAAIAEEASTAVETQSVSDVQDFGATGTKITKATINGTEADSLSATANGSEQTLVPTEITTASGQVITITANANGTYTGSDGYTYSFSGNTATNPGTYPVTVTGTKDGETDKTNTFEWTLNASSLTGVTASQTTFTYNGKDQSGDITYYLNGSALDMSKVTVTYVKNGQAAASGSTSLTDAGSYTAYIKGNGGTEYADMTAEVAITVNKLDLSTASVRIADTSSAAVPDARNVTVNGNTLSGIDVTFKSGSTASGSATNIYGDNGSYTFTVSAGDNDNVTGSKDVTFSKVETVLGNTAVNWGSNSHSVNLDDTNPSYFDASKVTVTANGSTLPSSSYSFTYEKENSDGTWSEVSANDLRSAGTYRVYVTVNAQANGYQYAVAADAFEFTVSHASTNAVASVSYDGKLVGDDNYGGTITADYDGTDVASKATITVRAGNTTLTRGTDYQVVYKKNGQTVSSITDAGTYTIEIQLLNGWKFGTNADGDAITVDTTNVIVNAQDVRAQVSTDGQLNYGSGYFFNHTGSAITPTLEFFTVDNDGDYVLDATSGRIVLASSATTATGDHYSKVDVPASAYTVTYTKDGKDSSTITDNGTYTVTIADAKNGDDADNYNVTAATTTVKVDDTRTFDDVANDAWYAQVIYDAKDLGYMNGYAGTRFFGPEDTFTRGQAACVLYNMAGGNSNANSSSNNGSSSSSNSSSTTIDASSTFSDVQDTDAYYYNAVTWAEHTGVIHGYGDGTFRPDQPVTREEFAAMLANYASKVGGYADGDESLLNSYPDASSVDDWAKSSVAWAVANKVMGNGSTLNPTGNITRAETAAMAVNFHNAAK